MDYPSRRANGHWLVYRLYSRDGLLLYVGCTKNLKARLADHALTKAWYGDVAKVEATDRFLDQRDAMRFERDLIKSSQPIHNVVYNTA